MKSSHGRRPLDRELRELLILADPLSAQTFGPYSVVGDGTSALVACELRSVVQ